MATPSGPVVPVHFVWPSAWTIATRAPDDRRCRVEPRHENQRVQRAVLHADAEIGDLNQAGANDGLALLRQTGACSIGCPSSTAVQTSPVPDGLSALARSRPCDESRRLSHRGGDRSGRRPARRGNRTPQVDDRLHQLTGLDGRSPLADVQEISRVEGQLRSARRLPYAVAVAKARERALMPVLDALGPGISQRLAVGRRQRRRIVADPGAGGLWVLRPASSSDRAGDSSSCQVCAAWRFRLRERPSPAGRRSRRPRSSARARRRLHRHPKGIGLRMSGLHAGSSHRPRRRTPAAP